MSNPKDAGQLTEAELDLIAGGQLDPAQVFLGMMQGVGYGDSYENSDLVRDLCLASGASCWI